VPRHAALRATPGERDVAFARSARAQRGRNVTWLEPFPDTLLAELADDAPGPEARLEQREAISLAFITAVQLLPPRQRAVLILRDVLGFRGREVAEMLDCTEESVSSALKRARSTLQQRLPKLDPASAREDPQAERELVERFVRAYEDGDVQALVSLLTEDAVLTTPLTPAQYVGRDLCGRFFASAIFGRGRAYRLVPTRANGQPAFGVYVQDPLADVAHAYGMWVLTLVDSRIKRMTRFDNSVISHFGLPRTLPKRQR
jgi:RNA polymerase sigma-70 factor (ECF subfamily)